MNSIRQRLILALAGSLAVLLIACFPGIYFFTRAILVRDFDAVLRSALAQVEQTLRQAMLEGYAQGREIRLETKREPPLYLQAWTPEGQVLARSASLQTNGFPFVSHLPHPETWQSVKLPENREGRALVSVRNWTFAETRERPPGRAEASTRQPKGAGKPVMEHRIAHLPPRVVLLVAADLGELESTLHRLSFVLWTVGILMLVSTVAVVTFVSRRGLAPLRSVADAAARIDASRLDFRFPARELPAELKVICERLNDLLSRLELSFQRERCFSADVAHELRTPIAELRSLAEVALKWPSTDPVVVNSFRDALDIALQMQAIVNGLLAIARCEAGTQPINRERVAGTEIIRKSWQPFAQRAAEKEHHVNVELPDLPPFETDPAMLSLVVTNLFSNAVEYTPRQGTITVRLQYDGADFDLCVANSVDNVLAEDLPHFFERFWRKDTARSSSEHSGIGLAVSKAFACALDMELQPSLSAGLLSMRLSLASSGRPANLLEQDLPASPS